MKTRQKDNYGRRMRWLRNHELQGQTFTEYMYGKQLANNFGRYIELREISHATINVVESSLNCGVIRFKRYESL